MKAFIVVTACVVVNLLLVRHSLERNLPFWYQILQCSALGANFVLLLVLLLLRLFS